MPADLPNVSEPRLGDIQRKLNSLCIVRSEVTLHCSEFSGSRGSVVNLHMGSPHLTIYNVNCTQSHRRAISIKNPRTEWQSSGRIHTPRARSSFFLWSPRDNNLRNACKTPRAAPLD